MDLKSFIALLEREGELARVRPEVDPYLEIAEIADRASKAHGPALLFEQPKRPAGAAGPAVPVLMNQFGSYRRLELALGAPLDDIAKRIGGLLELQVPSGWSARSRPSASSRSLPPTDPGSSRRPPSARSSSTRRTWPGCRCSPPGPETAARSSRCRSS